MTISGLLNASGLVLGFVGAVIFWYVGRREGPSLPFYPDAAGKILAEISDKGKKRDRIKNAAMALIASSFFCQLLALCV